jgi:NAD+ synthase
MTLIDQLTDWLRDHARRAGAKGYVVGLSGGIDSACTAALCRRAVGGNALAALMPCHSQPEDEELARLVVRTFDLETVTVDLGPVYDAFLAALPSQVTDMSRANIKPRLRMTTLYSLANARNYLVAGTGNKSELMVGYFTKYGDGGVDLEPLGGLYKSEVRALARELGVPQPIIDRPPTAGLWAGQTDEGEMGISYDQLDATLTAIESGRVDKVDPVLRQKVERMIAASAHKRSTPPSYQPQR